MFGEGEALFLGYAHGSFQSVDHPDLAGRDHKRKANRATIVRGIVFVVENKVSGFEAESEEVRDFVR